MLPLQFCKVCFDSHMIYRFRPSDAKACRTSDNRGAVMADTVGKAQH